jgi:CBS domain-containing protein
MDAHSLLPMVHFSEGVLPPRSLNDGQFLDINDPAVRAMTDFSREHPQTVDAERQIDDALNDMIRVGVRALLVCEERRIVGLVTSYDIQGERPMLYLQSSNYRHHSDIRVVDVMTSWQNLLALDWDEIQAMRAGELLRVFAATGLSHIIVVEHDRRHSPAMVRALVSRARLERQLRGLRQAS